MCNIENFDISLEQQTTSPPKSKYINVHVHGLCEFQMEVPQPWQEGRIGLVLCCIELTHGNSLSMLSYYSKMCFKRLVGVCFNYAAGTCRFSLYMYMYMYGALGDKNKNTCMLKWTIAGFSTKPNFPLFKANESYFKVVVPKSENII